MYVELIYSDLYGPDILITRVWNIFTCLLKHLFLTAVWILYIESFAPTDTKSLSSSCIFSQNKIFLYDNDKYDQFFLNLYKTLFCAQLYSC